MSTLSGAALFLGAAVIAVPISKYFGLGSVLGYLAAGIVLGPWGLNLFHQVEDLLHIAEFGVVLLLFIIGLELQPRRLWALPASTSTVGALYTVAPQAGGGSWWTPGRIPSSRVS